MCADGSPASLKAPTGNGRRSGPLHIGPSPTPNCPKAEATPTSSRRGAIGNRKSDIENAPAFYPNHTYTLDMAQTCSRRRSIVNRQSKIENDMLRTRPANRALKARCFGPRIRTANMTADRTCVYPKNVCAVAPRVCSNAVRNEAEVVTARQTARIC